MSLLLAGFILQAMIGAQMSEALDQVEELVVEQVREFQKSQKEKQEFMMMATKEQKRVSMMQEKAIKDIVY
jgi:flagellar biosynthesis protein FliP